MRYHSVILTSLTKNQTMLNSHLVMGLLLMLTSHISHAQENDLIGIKDKLIIAFEDGHQLMTQTRAERKEDALYNTFKDGAVKYVISKRGTLFNVYRKTFKGKWYLHDRYTLSQSFKAEDSDLVRYNFFLSDGSLISYLPEAETGKLVILDFASADVCYFVYE